MARALTEIDDSLGENRAENTFREFKAEGYEERRNEQDAESIGEKRRKSDIGNGEERETGAFTENREERTCESREKNLEKIFQRANGESSERRLCEEVSGNNRGRGSAGKKGRQMKCRQMGFLWRKPGIWRRR